MNKLTAGLTVLGAVLTTSVALAQSDKPTIVLVHGAFADTSSWNGVVGILEKDGYPVLAVANPLRGVKGDSEYLADILSAIKSPVILVGHSYAGFVISNAVNGNANVKALVYVDAFAPELGETAIGLSVKFPGSTLGQALASPVSLPNGGKDIYIQPEKFRDQFAADVSEADADLMAATQRPVTEAALNEPSSDPAWKTVPSWFVYGDEDKNIPPAALAFMAERAHSRQTVVVKGGSHVTLVSNPKPVAQLIESAAASTAAPAQ